MSERRHILPPGLFGYGGGGAPCVPRYAVNAGYGPPAQHWAPTVPRHAVGGGGGPGSYLRDSALRSDFYLGGGETYQARSYGDPYDRGKTSFAESEGALPHQHVRHVIAKSVMKHFNIPPEVHDEMNSCGSEVSNYRLDESFMVDGRNDQNLSLDKQIDNAIIRDNYDKTRIHYPDELQRENLEEKLEKARLAFVHTENEGFRELADTISAILHENFSD